MYHITQMGEVETFNVIKSKYEGCAIAVHLFASRIHDILIVKFLISLSGTLVFQYLCRYNPEHFRKHVTNIAADAHLPHWERFQIPKPSQSWKIMENANIL